MNLARWIPIVLTKKNIYALVLAISTLLLVFTSMEIFEWANRSFIDPTHSDPVISAWLFWFVVALVVMALSGQKVLTSFSGN